ncbi:MAG: hypothetical protein IKN62_08500 [Elusimicrobia bacterium]|nr:hypothetical protein [Elusimicrobiota bacterium]
MKRKFISIVLFLFIISSNVSYGLMSLVSFASEKSHINSSITVNIQEQYKSMFNLPKNFINMCVKVQEDFKILKINNSKLFFIDKDVEFFNNNLFATLSSPLKLKTYYIYDKTCIIDRISNYSNGAFILFAVIFIFYILRYVGLLKLFSSSDYFITKNGDLKSITLSK